VCLEFSFCLIFSDLITEHKGFRCHSLLCSGLIDHVVSEHHSLFEFVLLFAYFVLLSNTSFEVECRQPGTRCLEFCCAFIRDWLNLFGFSVSCWILVVIWLDLSVVLHEVIKFRSKIPILIIASCSELLKFIHRPKWILVWSIVHSFCMQKIRWVILLPFHLIQQELILEKWTGIRKTIFHGFVFEIVDLSLLDIFY